MNCLVLEDQQIFPDLLASMVESFTEISTVFKAGSIESANMIVDHHEIDLAILDIYLPDGECYDLAQYLFTQNLKEKEKQIIDLFQDKQKKDERALSLMSKKLKTSLEAGSIAHEINQPLSILKLTSQTLINSLDNNIDIGNMSTLKNQLLMINSQSERIVLITDKVRALLRNAQTELNELDLKQVIQSSLHYIKSNNPDIHDWIDSQQVNSIADSSAVINGDAIQLQIALINIFKNSIESLHESNNPNPLILVRLQDNKNDWIIEIEDNGGGLLPEMSEESLMDSSKPDGTGLGLFIVRTAMESHNGHLSLLKGSNGGLLAQLILPKNR